jgi:hypothetical protein
MFNFMRYNRAFFARQSDVARICEMVRQPSYAHFITEPHTIVLCKYDWLSSKKTNWQDGMLSSRQSIQSINDLNLLYLLKTQHTRLAPVKKLTVHVTQPVTGNFYEVIQWMFDNMAMPETEEDANEMESCFYGPDSVIAIDTCKYVDKQSLPNYKLKGRP